jgi:hypothetical protein
VKTSLITEAANDFLALVGKGTRGRAAEDRRWTILSETSNPKIKKIPWPLVFVPTIPVPQV